MQLTKQFRPQNLSDMIGQPHLVGPNGILTVMLQNKKISSMIFYGSPGCGKTTAARIIAKQSSLPYYEFNATKASLKDIRDAIQTSCHNPDFPALIYLDEIQYFNKKQQQSLLPYIEDGTIVLIGATTENPYFCCYDALLSRCITIEFKTISAVKIYEYMKNIICSQTNRTNIDNDALTAIANRASGDVRRALNMLNLAFTQYDENHQITYDDINVISPNINMSGFDTNSDNHYALISALQKSIRGSDPDAAVFYLARLLEGGDILSPCRRLLVIANEDIGLANPNAIAITYACVETAKQLGLPEATKPLTNAVLLLAMSPKTNTSETAYFPAVDDIKNGMGINIPKHIASECAPGYIYPHNYPNHWVSQQYLPDDLINRKYYVPGDNPMEQNAKNYWDNIKR